MDIFVCGRTQELEVCLRLGCQSDLPLSFFGYLAVVFSFLCLPRFSWFRGFSGTFVSRYNFECLVTIWSKRGDWCAFTCLWYYLFCFVFCSWILVPELSQRHSQSWSNFSGADMFTSQIVDNMLLNWMNLIISGWFIADSTISCKH